MGGRLGQKKAMKIFKTLNSKDSAISFQLLLEGFIKFNILLFGVCLALFAVKSFHVQDYFHLMKNQALLIIVAVPISKCYERLRYAIRFRTPTVHQLSFFLGIVVAIGLLYAWLLVLSNLPCTAEVSLLFGYQLILAVIYAAILIVLGKSSLMQGIIDLLKTCLTYKDFFRLCLMFNIAFFIAILAVLVSATRNKNILEILFAVLYLEISFFIFHIATAHLVDLIWKPRDKRPNNVSLFGICVGSVFYAIKLNVFDRKTIGSFITYDEFLLTAIVGLVLFWIFFTLLFHLGWRKCRVARRSLSRPSQNRA